MRVEAIPVYIVAERLQQTNATINTVLLDVCRHVLKRCVLISIVRSWNKFDL